MKEELKPCPFCGGGAIGVWHEPHEHPVLISMGLDFPPHLGSYSVICGACSAGLLEDTEAEAKELWNRRASPSAGQWIAFDIGCIECGEESAVIGVYSTEKEAEAACEKAAELQKAAWTGEHHMEVFQLPAPPLSDIKGERDEG